MKALILITSLLLLSATATAGIEESFLRVENMKLAELVDEQSGQIEELKTEIEVLKKRLGEADPAFNESTSISACGLIPNATYSSSSSDCIRSVKEFKVSAKIVRGCSKIRRSHYAVSCISAAGEFNSDITQVKECAMIPSPKHASECVRLAGVGGVQAETISACRSSARRSSLQLKCIEDAGI